MIKINVINIENLGIEGKLQISNVAQHVKINFVKKLGNLFLLLKTCCVEILTTVELKSCKS